MHCISIPHLFGPNTLRRTACARCASFSHGQTLGHGEHGFCLLPWVIIARSQLAPVLAATSPRSKVLVCKFHSGLATQSEGNLDVWTPSRQFVEVCKARWADLGGSGVATEVCSHYWARKGCQSNGACFFPRKN